MKKKITAPLVVAFLLVCIMFAACITQREQLSRASAWGYPPYTGFIEKSEPGYVGFPVRVRIDLEHGVIVAVDIDVRYQTPEWMQLDNLPYALEESVLATNSFEFDIDAFASASTVRAARDAGRRALLDIPGVRQDIFD